MESGSYTIRARVGAGMLDKADRLFRNDDKGTFIELLQNSRRAGATLVEVTINEIPKSPVVCAVSVQDNGRGIGDFTKLLTLWESGWGESTKEAEDPAGIGFYSLCRSDVEVFSGNWYCSITPAAFLGKTAATVVRREETTPGTRLCFIRSSSLNALKAALLDAAMFYPVEVTLNGQALPRYDFLEGAVHRQVIDGVEVGFAMQFTHGVRHPEVNWNFYGARLREEFPEFRGVIPPPGREHDDPLSLHVRFNVLETGRIKLQLPDRRTVIQDEFFHAFCRKVRTAGYRWFQTQERHLLSFKHWREAKELGVFLPEAVRQLATWANLSRDEYSEPMFGVDEPQFLDESQCVLLVSSDVANAHALQGAVNSGAKLDYALYRERGEFTGYRWYDELPRLTEIDVAIDGVFVKEQPFDPQKRPKTIHLVLHIERQPGLTTETTTITLPAAIHVDTDDFCSISFVAVENSPWDNDELAGPFDVTQFLSYATFSYSDEGDTFDTQLDRHNSEIECMVNEYFRGPRASLVALLHASLTGDVRHLANRLNVCSITVTRTSPAEPAWKFSLAGIDGQQL
jgi:hypothetical protein